jgi:hypothetical protein
MPIETRSAPAGVAHQLTTALEDIAPAPLGARTLEKSPMDISKPLPVYILGLQEAAGGAAFNKLTHGANAERLNDALHVAEQKYGSSTGYEARILDLPALNLGAVWLNGAQGNVFIPYLDESTLSGKPPSIYKDFKSKVESAAKQQIQRMRGREPNAP